MGNFCNPGAISHNQVLELYKEYIDPDLTWSNFTIEEQAKVIVAARSNNELSPHKLWKEFPNMLPITDSLREFVFKPLTTEKAKKAMAAKKMKAVFSRFCARLILVASNESDRT